MSGIERINSWDPATELQQQRLPWAMSGLAFSFVAATITAATILLTAITSGMLYHMFAYGDTSAPMDHAGLGLLVAFFYVLPFAFRNEFSLEAFAAGSRSATRLALVWTYAFIALGLVAFLTKTTADYSRGWLLLFYVTGFAGVVGADALIRYSADRALLAGRLARRRLMLKSAISLTLRSAPGSPTTSQRPLSCPTDRPRTGSRQSISCWSGP
jgi:CoA-binding domain